ncbi:hypothetical protein BC834DRAFT_297856 [Gloeopeniophorella convolvens]|nr:hypothetical protein BC834DRAFT_297856 [Gloeopeniophorella convolvens]
MAQERVAWADGNKSDGAAPEPRTAGPTRGTEREKAGTSASATLINSRHAGNAPNPRLPSPATQCRPQVIKARHSAGVKAAQISRRRHSPPPQGTLKARKERAVASKGRASHVYAISSVPGSSGSALQQEAIPPPPSQPRTPPCAQVLRPPAPPAPTLPDDDAPPDEDEVNDEDPEAFLSDPRLRNDPRNRPYRPAAWMRFPAQGNKFATTAQLPQLKNVIAKICKQSIYYLFFTSAFPDADVRLRMLRRTSFDVA